MFDATTKSLKTSLFEKMTSVRPTADGPTLGELYEEHVAPSVNAYGPFALLLLAVPVGIKVYKKYFKKSKSTLSISGGKGMFKQKK